MQRRRAASRRSFTSNVKLQQRAKCNSSTEGIVILTLHMSFATTSGDRQRSHYDQQRDRIDRKFTTDLSTALRFSSLSRGRTFNKGDRSVKDRKSLDGKINASLVRCMAFILRSVSVSADIPTSYSERHESAKGVG
jgi:hypothetical protein